MSNYNKFDVKKYAINKKELEWKKYLWTYFRLIYLSHKWFW